MENQSLKYDPLGSTRRIRRILIANRGEIACRIIKTAKEMGIETVAIYSAVDEQSLHVQLAHQSVFVGEPEATKSYLCIEKIIQVAIQTKCDAIHPGNS